MSDRLTDVKRTRCFVRRSAVKVKSPYDRNWNCENARIGEKNWFAFSWKVEGTNLTLVQILTGHLLGFTKPK